MEKKSVSKNLSRYHFRFNEIPVDSELERSTNLRLVQFLAVAPPGAKAVGFVEKDNHRYLCAIEISSPYRTFFERSSGLTPESAINWTLEKMEDQLYRWRYGGGKSGSFMGPPIQYNQTQPQG